MIEARQIAAGASQVWIGSGLLEAGAAGFAVRLPTPSGR
jgi:hypothetical protein